MTMSFIQFIQSSDLENALDNFFDQLSAQSSSTEEVLPLDSLIDKLESGTEENNFSQLLTKGYCEDCFAGFEQTDQPVEVKFYPEALILKELCLECFNKRNGQVVNA